MFVAIVVIASDVQKMMVALDVANECVRFEKDQSYFDEKQMLLLLAMLIIMMLMLMMMMKTDVSEDEKMWIQMRQMTASEWRPID